MILTIQLPDDLDAALRAHANAEGISEEGYVRTLVERELAERVDFERAKFAADRIRELRKGNFLPDCVTIRSLIDEGRS